MRSACSRACVRGGRHEIGRCRRVRRGDRRPRSGAGARRPRRRRPGSGRPRRRTPAVGATRRRLAELRRPRLRRSGQRIRSPDTSCGSARPRRFPAGSRRWSSAGGCSRADASRPIRSACRCRSHRGWRWRERARGSASPSRGTPRSQRPSPGSSTPPGRSGCSASWTIAASPSSSGRFRLTSTGCSGRRSRGHRASRRRCRRAMASGTSTSSGIAPADSRATSSAGRRR